VPETQGCGGLSFAPSIDDYLPLTTLPDGPKRPESASGHHAVGNQMLEKRSRTCNTRSAQAGVSFRGLFTIELTS